MVLWRTAAGCVWNLLCVARAALNFGVSPCSRTRARRARRYNSAIGAARTRSVRNFGRSPLDGEPGFPGVEPGILGWSQAPPGEPGSTPNRPAPPQNSARLPGSPRGVEPGSPTRGSPAPPDWGAAAPHPGESGSPAPHSAEPRSGARRWRHQQPSHVSHSRPRTSRLGRPRGAGHRQWSGLLVKVARCACSPDYTLLVIVPLAHPLLASAEAGTFLEAALPCRYPDQF